MIVVVESHRRLYEFLYGSFLTLALVVVFLPAARSEEPMCDTHRGLRLKVS